MKYWVERWSELRKKEMVQYPKEFCIHQDCMEVCDEEEFRNGFEELFGIYGVAVAVIRISKWYHVRKIICFI